MATIAKPSHKDLLIYGFAPYQLKTNEEYMNSGQIAHFRGILLAWKKELMEEVDRTVHHMQDESGSLPDPNDRATQEEEFSIELRARDRERKLIRKIDSTLKSIDEGDYGYCEECGVEIGIRRLEAPRPQLYVLTAKHSLKLKKNKLAVNCPLIC